MTRHFQPARLGVLWASSMLLATLLFATVEPARKHAAPAVLKVTLGAPSDGSCLGCHTRGFAR